MILIYLVVIILLQQILFMKIDRLEQELQDVEGSSAWVLTTTYNDDKANYFQKKITSGSAAPSGGSNGDIYIQYFSE